VGTIVMLRRPPDRAALHFYAICLLFFLMYSTSYTGKLNWTDWTLLWSDTLAILFLPWSYLHFCLPSRAPHFALAGMADPRRLHAGAGAGGRGGGQPGLVS